jgi:hypothetical protein
MVHAVDKELAMALIYASALVPPVVVLAYLYVATH